MNLAIDRKHAAKIGKSIDNIRLQLLVCQLESCDLLLLRDALCLERRKFVAELLERADPIRVVDTSDEGRGLRIAVRSPMTMRKLTDRLGEFFKAEDCLIGGLSQASLLAFGSG